MINHIDEAQSGKTVQTVHSLLQKPPKKVINVQDALKNYVGNYTSHQMDYFLNKMSPQKFQKLLYKEVKPN